jgi:hypothetical protein
MKAINMISNILDHQGARYRARPSLVKKMGIILTMLDKLFGQFIQCLKIGGTCA